MNIDTSALLSTLLGVACGMYFVTKFQKFLVHLVYVLRLVIDKPYTYKLYNDLSNINFVQAAKYQLNFLQFDDHMQAISASKLLYQQSLIDEYTVVGKELLFQLARMLVIPCIICGVLGQAVAFLGAAFVSILALTWYETLLVHGPNFSKYARLSILLRHIYADSKYSNASIKKDRAKTKPQDKTPILTQSLVPTTPLITHSHIVSDTTTPEKPMLIANQADPETESALIQVESGIISSENTDKKDFSLTWQKIWWGNDFALCIILTVIYWITSAQSIGDYFLGPIQVIIIVQLFFVPVWAVIIVSIKLLNKYK